MSRAKIYFIRHGETYLNKYKRMQGWSDAPLTSQGIQSAKDTGVKLKDVKFDAVFSSDLGRTIETAKLILGENCYKEGISIVPKKEFRETFFGYFEGTQGEAYKEVAKLLQMDPKDLFSKLSLNELMDATKSADPTKDAEDSKEFLDRLLKGMNGLLQEIDTKSYQSVLVVTHGNTIRNLVQLYNKEINVFQEIGNSSVTTLEYEDGLVKVSEFNQ